MHTPKKRKIKRVLKEEKKNLQRHEKVRRAIAGRIFHPAVELLSQAAHELVMFVAIARETGVRFDDWTHSNGNFRATAPREHHELRGLALFAELERDKGFDVRYGLRLSYYDGSAQNRFVVDVVLWARVSKRDKWTLERETRESAPRPDQDVRHSVRRLGAGSGAPRRKQEGDALKTAIRMIREYHEVVTIPRLARDRREQP